MITELWLGVLFAAVATLLLALLAAATLVVMVVLFLRRFRVMHVERVGDDVVANGRWNK